MYVIAKDSSSHITYFIDKEWTLNTKFSLETII